MDPWLNALVHHVEHLLGNDWTHQRMPRGAYFFKRAWREHFHGWGHNFTPYHMLINNYHVDYPRLHCIIRLEIQNILQGLGAESMTLDQLRQIPVNVLQFFFQNGRLQRGQRDLNMFNNIFCIDISNERSLELPADFWVRSPNMLPNNVVEQIDQFLGTPLSMNFRQL